MQPVKASGFFNSGLTTDEQQALINAGIVPVNDVFFDLWGNTNPINLLFGGYGSGKSVFIAQELIRHVREDKYFKCYYGRKVHDDVRNSVFDTIASVIEDQNMRHLFSYSRADNSTMVIRCRANGNVFIPFGARDPEGLKSIKDPTHIWCEELDQFDDGDGEEKAGDFALLYPRLRTSKAITQFYGSFNTSQVFETHWILKYFFPELYKGDDKPEFDFLEDVTVSKTFANYTDNYFIDQAAYYQKLRLASAGSQSVLDAIAAGAWGVTDNKNPWLYAFEHQKHVTQKIPFLPSFPVYLSFDFNNDPFACTAWQMSPNKGGKDSFIHGLKEFSGIMKVEEMCQRIATEYPYSILFITGDRSGQNEDVGRNQTLYQIIAGLLGVNDKLINTPTTNLEHADSKMLMNTMFANYPNVKLSREGMPNFIQQCHKAKNDPDSKKPSQLLKDRGSNKNDEFDAGRYFFQTYFNEFAKLTYFRALKKK